MRPAISCPGTIGYSMDGIPPSTVSESEWQTPHASMRTRTSPRAGSRDLALGELEALAWGRDLDDA